MNRDEFEAWFKNTGTPFLDRFQQETTDALLSRWVFWTIMTLSVIGVVTVFRWVI